jgi:hypothetical protein
MYYVLCIQFCEEAIISLNDAWFHVILSPSLEPYFSQLLDISRFTPMI